MTVGPPRGSALDRAADDVLADRAADGDTRAFAVLVRRYGRLLRTYATRVLGSDLQSDDVVQDALVVAWQQLGGLEDRAAVRAWLIRITTRKALDALRARRPQSDIDDHDVPAPAGSGPEQRARVASLTEALSRALADLPAEQGRIWAMRELGGYSYDEIAAELDLPASTVRGQLARARSRLLRDMDDWR